MKRSIKRIVSLMMLFGIYTAASAASDPTPVALLCDTSRLDDGGKVQMSAVLTENDHLVVINGKSFPNASFTEYRVTGKSRSPNTRIDGVMDEATFSIDRVTGSFSYMTLPVPGNGTGFTEDQKTKIRASSLAPAFIGSCAVSKPKF